MSQVSHMRPIGRGSRRIQQVTYRTTEHTQKHNFGTNFDKHRSVQMTWKVIKRDVVLYGGPDSVGVAWAWQIRGCHGRGGRGLVMWAESQRDGGGGVFSGGVHVCWVAASWRLYIAGHSQTSQDRKLLYFILLLPSCVYTTRENNV